MLDLEICFTNRFYAGSDHQLVLIIKSKEEEGQEEILISID